MSNIFGEGLTPSEQTVDPETLPPANIQAGIEPKQPQQAEAHPHKELVTSRFHIFDLGRVAIPSQPRHEERKH